MYNYSNGAGAWSNLYRLGVAWTYNSMRILGHGNPGRGHVPSFPSASSLFLPYLHPLSPSYIAY